MNQKISYSLLGFMAGIVFILALNVGNLNLKFLPFQIGESKTQHSLGLAKANELIDSGKIKELRIEENKAILRDYLNEDFTFSLNSDTERENLLEKVTSHNVSNSNNSIDVYEAPDKNFAFNNPIPQLFQILFILFIISPPIIVVLLLIIIKKMNCKNSAD